MGEGSNWVDRRFAIESSLRKNAPIFWQDVRSAIEDACEHFLGLYGASTGIMLEVKRENGRRLRIVSMAQGHR
jgi:hypothetical protein